jgi:hypothetical protein
MTEQRVSETELTSAAMVAAVSAVIAWYSSSLTGVQGVTDAAIAVVVTLAFFFAGLLTLKRWNPSWYSSG